MKRLTFPDPQSCALALAAGLSERLVRLAETRGGASLAVPGGATPSSLFSQLAARSEVPWDRVTLVLTDERTGDADPAQTNLNLLRQTLIAGLKTPPRPVLVPGPELVLREPVDLVVLGCGVDGHIASLFPGDEARPGAVLQTWSPLPPHHRTSLGMDIFAKAGEIALLTTGDAKRDTVDRAWREKRGPLGKLFGIRCDVTHYHGESSPQDESAAKDQFNDHPNL